MSVSASANESESEFSLRWKRFDALPDDIKSLLSSEKVIQIIQKIAKKYSLSDDQMADIARMVRSYYFGELKESDFPQYMVSHAHVDESTSTKIGRLVTKYIISQASASFTNTATDDTKTIKKTNVPLSEAMRLYPKISHQIITIAQIKLSNRQTLVSGTVKNWIYDYRDSLGSGKHSSMERGTYLFNTPNTKTLSASERNHLSVILRSHDENIPLSIDIDNKIILFPQETQQSADIKKTVPQNIQGSSLSQIHSNAAFKIPPATEKGITNNAKKLVNGSNVATKNSAKLSSAKTVRQVTQPQQKHHVVGTEDKMTFTSPHALPSEKENEQNEQDKTPFHMIPIGAQKTQPQQVASSKS